MNEIKSKEDKAIIRIKKFFKAKNKKFKYENQNGNTVNCNMIDDGIEVDCLSASGHQSFSPWGVFWHAVHIIEANGGEASRGEALGGRLGSNELPLNSAEGHIANSVYGRI